MIPRVVVRHLYCTSKATGKQQPDHELTLDRHTLLLPAPTLAGLAVLLAVGLVRGILPRWFLALGGVIAKFERRH